jgi:tryptophan synthase beta chain
MRKGPRTSGGPFEPGAPSPGEGAGDPRRSARASSSLTLGRFGVLHGSASLVLQNDDGQIAEAHSVSAGLDYPGVGPELAFLKEKGRLEVRTATDDEALEAFSLLCRAEGILPALESSHALARAGEIAREVGKSGAVLVNLSRRGDKDLSHALAELDKRKGTP